MDYPPGNEAVLFAGNTWTWDGSDWTQHTGQGSPESSSGVAYDAANENVVSFGGFDDDYLDETEVWDGTTWSYRNPVHSPKPRDNPGMTYDAAVGRLVLFGGRHYNTTWTWNGTDWRHRKTRHQALGGNNIVYDAQRGNVLLLTNSGSTWTWDGNDWTQHVGGSIGALNPRSGPPGTTLSLDVWGYAAGEQVRLTFIDSAHGSTVLKDVLVNGDGAAYSHDSEQCHSGQAIHRRRGPDQSPGRESALQRHVREGT